jgi:predicted LPLAT superfamily acyltransferase
MPSWKGKTRGGLLGHQIFVFVLKKLGLTAAYLLLRFVAAYFIVFAPKATSSLYKYFRQIHQQGMLRAFLSVYKNFYVFGQTLLDKVAIVSGLESKYTYTFDGAQHLASLKETGGIIMSAHLGNWDIAGFLLDNLNLKTNILVFEAEHEKIKGYLDHVMKNKKVNIIPMKQDLSHIFKVNTALRNKEIICMHGDRFLEGSRVAKKKFMGNEAFFPLGPFSIISKLKVPYSFAYAVRGENRQYHLSATPIKVANASPETLLDEYIEILEAKMEKYPLQWFNYYDFWDEKVEGAVLDK